MRVTLNDRPLRQALTGVGHYVRELLLHIPTVAPDIRIEPFFFSHFSRRDWRNPPSTPPATTAAAAARPARRYPWWIRRALQAAYLAAFRTLTRGCNLYHEPNHIPMATRLPTITTVHDLSVLVHPEWHPADRVRWYEREFTAGLRRSQRFIAASEYTRREMIARLSIPADRIDVTYQAPRAAFRPAPAEQQQAVLSRFHLSPGFLLYVGTLEPRKNLPGLLRAYAGLSADLRRRAPLVLAGGWGWGEGELQQHLSAAHIAADVRLTGYLADDDLAALYSACAALAWPTFYEGFGMPPLEAMACGAPVITSNATSLPEVVGDAGVLLDPADEDAWREALRRAVEDDAWRTERRAAGLARATGFSWQRCAAQTVAAYRRTLT
ncbi:MAG: glycosyltransferase family 4 protein [Phycisphaerales bacterium]|nr:glycosyltransferase family 4 protein [Phycisphaerales bacterium]